MTLVVVLFIAYQEVLVLGFSVNFFPTASLVILFHYHISISKSLSTAVRNN